MSDAPVAPAPMGDVPAEPSVHHAESLAVALGGGLNLAGSAFNSLVRFSVTVLIGRLLGGSAVGLFYQAFAVHDLVALVLAGGFMSALTRFVALHRAENEEAALRGVVRLGLVIPTVAAAGAAVILWIAAPWLATSAFGDPPMRDFLRLIAVAMPATVFTDVALAATRGWRTMKPFALVSLVFEPLFRLVLTIGVFASGGGVRGALVALVVTNYIAAAMSALILRRMMPRSAGPAEYHLRELFSFSALAWASTLVIDLFIWADTILIGIFRSPAEVGIYQVATRLVLLSAIFVFPMGAAFAPRIAHLYQRGERDALQRTYATVAGWVLRLAIPAFCILVLFAKPLLRLFGPDFTAGSSVTVLLAFGALAHASTGPSNQVLTMTGKPGLLFVNQSVAVIFNIALNLILIPAYGVTGAAVAWLASILLTNVLGALQIYRALNMHPFGMPMVKGVVAGAIALGAGFLLRPLLHGSLQIIAAIAGVILVYGIASVVLGITSEDRMLLRQIRTRGRSAHA